MSSLQVCCDSLLVCHAEQFTDPLVGIAVSSTGRKFSNYPPALDANNTKDATNAKYTVAELTSSNTERPYPSVEINSPPGGAINYTTFPAS